MTTAGSAGAHALFSQMPSSEQLAQPLHFQHCIKKDRDELEAEEKCISEEEEEEEDILPHVVLQRTWRVPLTEMLRDLLTKVGHRREGGRVKKHEPKRHTWSTEVCGLRDFWRNSSSIIGVGISRMPKKSLPSLKCSAMETIAVGDDIGDAVRIPCLEKSGVPKGLIRHFRHCPKQPEGQATTFGRRPWARNKTKIEVVSAGLQANCVHDALHPRRHTRSRMILQSCLAGNLRLQIFVYSVQSQSAISAAVVHMYRVYVSSHIEERSSRVVDMVVRGWNDFYSSYCYPVSYWPVWDEAASDPPPIRLLLYMMVSQKSWHTQLRPYAARKTNGDNIDAVRRTNTGTVRRENQRRGIVGVRASSGAPAQ
ncbi:hypothetical protein DFH07DRAFT_771809 [Mycena maculata]|uniref:Uncharacterized protein n=1 Tax=Mycena maculata TaxID=230809 RepID=A0AAD7JAJ5_9AGAR|nr:hypothetical protein DFH07DRAFT_771809 [Mycena maculata]